MKHRAYSILDVKEMSEEAEVIRVKGIASTPTTDRMGDVVEPMGARFKTPMPLLWQHRHDEPVGHVVFAQPTKAGIPFEATLPIIREAGRLKDRVDEAIQSLRYRLVAAVSIGFAAIDGAIERIETGLRFKEWEWLELSLVTIPANAEATITAIRSIDAELLAANGQPPPGDDPPPRVVGKQAEPAKRGFFFVPTRSNEVKTIQEQIAALEAARAAKAARMTEIMQKSIEEGRSTDASEQEEFDGLSAEVQSADGDLVRLRSLEKLNLSMARPVTGKSADDAGQSRGPTIIIPKHDPDEKFEGQNFTRRVIAKALAYIEQRPAGQIAAERWGKSHPQLVEVIKAGVAAGSTGTATGDWGSELVSADARYMGDFIEYLYGRTVFHQLPLREVPENVTIKGQDGAATAYWVGEGKPIPVTSMDFSDVTLTSLEIDALAAITKRLLRESSPSAEMLVRDGIIQAARQRIDTTFLSTAAAVSGVSPAGILNGLAAGTASGTDADALRADIATLYSGFITAKNAMGLYWVMGPSLAKQVSLMRNALGQREFPDLTQMGGSLEGDPVITGDNVGDGDFILLKPSDIYKIGDRGMSVSISDQATIEMANDPTGDAGVPTAQSKQMVSMFQSNSVALKLTMPLNYAKRRTSAVAYIGDADYGSGAT